ncbi:TRAP transporter small permease [Oceanicella sp. SM1341]|uniref:TRAP transporter small permease n=1 Tax=Oceanicella sp. SM1341 TaxID=1548889 RepID=UPI000E4E983F|nr:TRAP transporter small permease [Oceanicella sp. SM1341]
MQRLISLLVGLSRAAVGIAFVALIATVLMQVFARTFLPGSPIWTEELSRAALMFLAACGVGLSMRSGDLVNVDLVVSMLPRNARRVALGISAALTAVLAGLMFMPALKFMNVGAMQTAPALGIHMNWIYLAMPVFAVSLCVFAVLAVLEIIAGRDSFSDMSELED